MQYNTKLNVGDNVWHINDGKIVSSNIAEICIRHLRHIPTPLIDYKWEGISRSEESEGKLWWRTRDALVQHLLGGPIQPCHSECQCTGGGVSLEELLNEMMAGDKTPNPSESVLVEAFENFFKEPPKKAPHCGCGHCEHQDLEGVLSDMPKFQSGRPKHVTEEEAFVKELQRQSKPKLTEAEMERIDNEFNQLFGEHICTLSKNKSKNELDQLYDELFDR